MLFSAFERLLFDFHVPKNQNILTFTNIKAKQCAKTPLMQQMSKQLKINNLT